jgi:Domain of unknown function (DUF4282)
MTEQSSGQGRSDDWSRYFPGEQYADEQHYGATGSPRPGQPGSGPGGYGSGQGGASYGSSGRDDAGYGSSAQGGAGAARPSPGMAGSASTGPGSPVPGMATTPIWQAGPGQGAPGQGAPGQGAPGQARPGFGGPSPTGAQPMGRPMMEPQTADARGFLSALFDFSFTSFVTTRIIKVLYVLILILVLLSALIFTYDMFRVSALTGLLTLVIGDPLFILIVMAFWRLVLESFVVRFRIAEDVRAMRERGGR